jgi:hypothetical protein
MLRPAKIKIELSLDQFIFDYLQAPGAKVHSPEALEQAYNDARKLKRQQADRIDAVTAPVNAEIDPIIMPVKETKTDAIDLVPKYTDGDGFRLYMKLVVQHEMNGNADEQAKKLLTLLGDTASAIQYLKRYTAQHRNLQTPIHDACLFRLPSALHLAFWQKLAKKYLDQKRFITLLDRAAEIEKFPTFRTDMGIDNLMEILHRLSYGDYKEEHREAARIFQAYSVPKEVFQRYITLKPLDDDKQIPQVSIKVKDDKATYSIQKLSSSDPRAAILGYITGCCQSVGNENGGSSAEYGMTKPDSGFYIVLNEKGEIIAQMWVFRVGDTLVLDSVEPNNAVFANKQILLTQLVETLAEAILKNQDAGIKHIHVGCGGRTPRMLGVMTDHAGTSCKPLVQGVYTDSSKQREIIVTTEALCEALNLPKDLSADAALKSITTMPDLIIALPYVQYMQYKDKKHSSQDLWESFLGRCKELIVSTQNMAEIFEYLHQKNRTEVYHAIKDEIPGMIEQFDDLSIYKKILTADQYAEVCDDVLGKRSAELVETIQELFQIENVFEYLNQKNRTEIYHAIKHQLPGMIKNIQGFLKLKEILTADQYFEVCSSEELLERIPKMINSPGHLRQLKEILTQDQYSKIYPTLKKYHQMLIEVMASDKFPNAFIQFLDDKPKVIPRAEIVNDCWFFVARMAPEECGHLLKRLTLEECTGICENMYLTISKNMRSVSQLIELLRPLSKEQSAIVWHYIRYSLSHLFQTNTTLAEFLDIQHKLKTEKNMELIYEWYAHGDDYGLGKIISSTSDSDLRISMKYLTPEQCILASNVLLARNEYESENDGFYQIYSPEKTTPLKYLSSDYITREQFPAVYAVFKPRLPVLINSSDHLIYLLKLLENPDQRTDVYRCLKDQIPSIITLDVLAQLKCQGLVTAEQQVFICQILKELPFKSVDEFTELTQSLNEQQRVDLFNAYQVQLAAMINSVYDFNKINLMLSEAQRIKLTDLLQDRWHIIFNSNKQIYGVSLRKINFEEAKLVKKDWQEFTFQNVDFRDAKCVKRDLVSQAKFYNIRVSLTEKERVEFEKLWQECKSTTDSGSSQLRDFLKKAYPTEGSFLFFHKRTCAEVANCLSRTTSDKDLFDALAQVCVHNITGTFVKVFSFVKDKNDVVPFQGNTGGGFGPHLSHGIT